jgi:hypothetical protein
MTESVTIYGSKAGEHELERLYRKTLAALPFACLERDVQTRFGRAHVIVCGPPEGAPLMLWHGAAAPAPFMLDSCKLLAEHYRVYAPDLPCQGQSGFMFTMQTELCRVARASPAGVPTIV